MINPAFTASNNNGASAPVLREGRPLFLRSNRILYCIEAMRTAGAGKSQ